MNLAGFTFLFHSRFANVNVWKYKYPHNYGGYVEQQYMPDSLKDRVYYVPGKNGKEKNLIRKKFRGENK